jgi:hypothetical protein
MRFTNGWGLPILAANGEVYIWQLRPMRVVKQRFGRLTRRVHRRRRAPPFIVMHHRDDEQTQTQAPAAVGLTRRRRRSSASSSR